MGRGSQDSHSRNDEQKVPANEIGHSDDTCRTRAHFLFHTTSLATLRKAYGIAEVSCVAAEGVVDDGEMMYLDKRLLVVLLQIGGFPILGNLGCIDYGLILLHYCCFQSSSSFVLLRVFPSCVVLLHPIVISSVEHTAKSSSIS